jgi:hypothetical protein
MQWGRVGLGSPEATLPFANPKTKCNLSCFDTARADGAHQHEEGSKNESQVVKVQVVDAAPTAENIIVHPQSIVSSASRFSGSYLTFVSFSNFYPRFTAGPVPLAYPT